MNTVLVTGGAGFLGSHLCQKLIKIGYKVICIDNLFTGSLKNIEAILENKNFRFLNHDINIPIENVNADYVFNLACPASPFQYQKYPVETIKTNVLGTLNVLELVKKNNARVLQASTSEVYGNPLEHPQSEEYLGNVNPIGPRACYDEGKRAAETLFYDYNRQFGVDIRVARIFNTYGPNMAKDDGRVVSNFIIQALKGNPITIYGDGNQTRSFCYVDDLIEGLIKLMFNLKRKLPVNLGNPQEVKIKYLASQICKLIGNKQVIATKELPSDDPIRRNPDIKIATNYLNWKPKTNLELGLKNTIKYFKKIS
ncbi:MAG: NAD-dependent dehydratase [Candidatus Marinimicrobia bacterium]|nr:NAD-dependent dehydratase [Candidatus Neomarinimicrobiota bacterium]